MLEKVRANNVEETDERIPRDVHLGDHLGSFDQRSEPTRELSMVVVDIGAELVGI